MKRLQTIVGVAAVLLALAALLVWVPGCATIPETPQGVINEGRASLIAAVRLNRSYLNEGVITPAEHDQKLAQIEKWQKDLDDAESLLVLGKGLEAIDKAKLVRSAALALRAELARRATR